MKTLVSDALGAQLRHLVCELDCLPASVECLKCTADLEWNYEHYRELEFSDVSEIVSNVRLDPNSSLRRVVVVDVNRDMLKRLPLPFYRWFELLEAKFRAVNVEFDWGRMCWDEEVGIV